MANGINGLAGLQRSEFPIARTNSANSVGQEGSSAQVGGSKGPDFADAFAEAITNASTDEKVATDMSVKFADGDPSVGIHDVVIASEKANLSLKYTVTLKNKLLEAYRDIMSTQV